MHITPSEGTGDHYEIELLLDRRERHPKGREPVVEYLVKWKNWSAYWNPWYHIRGLPNASEAIADYEKKYGRQSVREYQKAQGRTDDTMAPSEQSEAGQPVPPPPEPPTTAARPPKEECFVKEDIFDAGK